MAVQIYNWPWKAPILNVVDMAICFLLAILVVVAGFYVPVSSGGLLEFFEIFSMVVFVLLFGVVACLHMPQWSSGLADTRCHCHTTFECAGVLELCPSWIRSEVCEATTSSQVPNLLASGYKLEIPDSALMV